MEKLRFIHAADLHLDTPFRALSSVDEELARRLKEATFNSFRRIVDLCIEKEVDFLLIAGDTFDREDQSLAAQLRFVRELERLSAAGIHTYLVCGNHDPLVSWVEEMQLPDRVVRFGSSKVGKAVYEKAGRPLAAIYGISYRTAREDRDLAGKFRGPDGDTPFSIAMMHATPDDPGPHEPYARFRLKELIHKGYDYWALGHIHKRNTLRDHAPAVVYPGNPQGRDFGETGRRGCVLVEMEKGRKPGIEFIPTQEVRFEEVRIDMSGVDGFNELTHLDRMALERISDPHPEDSYILRIVLEGRTPLHKRLARSGELEELRKALNEEAAAGTPFLFIDSILSETRPDINLEELREGNDFTAALIKKVESLEPEAFLQEVEEASGLPPAVLRRVHLDSAGKRDLLEKVKWMLLDQIIKEE